MPQPESNWGFTLFLKILADPRRLRQVIKKLPVMEEELGDENDGQTVYSLRYTYATCLRQEDVRPYVLACNLGTPA